jgi:hypothetical protein
VRDPALYLQSGRSLTVVNAASRLLAELREQILRPVPMSLTGLDAILEKFDQTIDNLVERRDMLTGYRERLTRAPAVHSLPEDILISVFQMCIWSPYHTSVTVHHMSSIRAPYFRFFSFSWVCRAWRCLALNTPILWTDIILTNPAVTAVMLERAKDALLRVFIDLRSSGRFNDLRSKPAAISSVLQKTPQISDLSISGSYSNPEILGVFCTLNQSEPRCLRSLNVYMPERSSLSLGPSHTSHLSTLSTLSLARCSFSSGILAFCRLTQLHLNGERAWGNSRCDYPLDFLMQTLAHLPQLTEVTLYSCIKKNPFPNHLKDPVRLPSLRSLSINDDIRICLAVLQSITGCLSLMHLSIGVIAEDVRSVQSSRSDVLRALFPQIRRLYVSSNTCPRSFQSLDIENPIFKDEPLRICGSWRQFGDERASFGYRRDSDDGFSFRLEKPTSAELMTAMELAVTNLPLTWISCLHATPSATFRRRPVLALASLTRIVVENSACRHFIASWCSPTHAAGGSVTQFPALESLLFRECDVYLRPPLTDTRSELQSLIDTVRLYSAEGRPLKQLTFFSCFFENKDNDMYYPIVDKGIIRARFEPYVALLEIKGIRSRPLH